MHGKTLRNKYTDNHVQRGEYQHVSTCNRAEKTVNWLAIDCWKLIFTMPVHSTPEKVLFLGTNLQLLDTGTKPSSRVNHCCKNLTTAFFITHKSFFLSQACFVSRGWLESLAIVSSISVQRTYQVRIRVLYSTNIRQYPCGSESPKIWGRWRMRMQSIPGLLSPPPRARRPGDEAR